MRIGIDASNIISGGGLTHLVELLKAAPIGEGGIESLTVWSCRQTLEKITPREQLHLRSHPHLEAGIAKRFLWQKKVLPEELKKETDILFVPGSSYTGNFRPFITMNRNLLPFDYEARRRYGFSRSYFRLYLLEKIQTRTFRKSDGVIFLTQEALRLTEQKMKSSVSNVRIIPHGISEHFFTKPRRQEPVSSYSKEKPFRILYVSSVTVYKHQAQVIEAVHRLYKKGYPVKLDLVGPITTGQGQKLLDKAIEKFDPNNSFVRFHGKKSQEELSEFYRQANLFVFASSCETFGQILLEAMASGLPIACSDRSGMPEVLKDNGLYFDPEDPESIYRAVEELLLSKDLRQSLSEAGFREARAFSWKACAEQTFGFIREVYNESVSA